MTRTKKSSTKTARGRFGKGKPAGHGETPPTGDTPDRHQLAVAALKVMFQLWPAESARWILHASTHENPLLEILDARWIEQAPRGPAYVVPSPREQPDTPPTTEELFGRMFTRALVDEAAESKGKLDVGVNHFDFAEAAR